MGFFVNDTPDLSVTVVPLEKTPICISENKKTLLLLANTEPILSASMIGNIVTIYHFLLRGCFLY